MSLRNFRKIHGGTTLPDPESSDDDFDPHAKALSSSFKYQGLEIASSSKSESETDKSDNMPEEPVPVNPGMKKKINKKKKKRMKTLQGISDKLDDEVEKSVREVDRILGKIDSCTLQGPSTSGQPVQDLGSCMHVQAKHLDVTYEIKRKFGKEVLPEQKKRGRQNPLIGFGKKCVIIPMAKYKFIKNGLTMSENRRSNDGKVYFTYDHDKDYQRMQREFFRIFWLSSNESIMDNELIEAQANYHIEVLLQCVDILFTVDAHNLANTLLELSIAYLQYAASPKFDVADMNTRLEYKFLENRPFHVAILKYLYLLSNRACHRTALELAKMLLNLDPTDPLAVLMVIDVIALRAREHAWLIDAVEKWKTEREAESLYNIQYSVALAQYHVSKKQKVSLKEATELLEEAMMNFPSVAMFILTYTGQKIDTKLTEHPFFTTMAKKTTSKSLNQMTSLYAALVWEKFREPGIMDWFTETAKQLCDKYDGDIRNMKERNRNAGRIRMALFSGYSLEMVRHVNVILPMSDLICEGRVPDLRYTRINNFAADPFPTTALSSRQSVENRYNYTRAPSTDSPVFRNWPEQAILDFFSSMFPTPTA